MNKLPQIPASPSDLKYAPRFLIKETDAVVVKGRTLTFARTTDSVQVLINEYGIEQSYSHEEIYHLYSHHQFAIKRGYYKKTNEENGALSSGFTLNQFSEYKVAKALLYAEVADEIIKVEGKKLPELIERGYKRKAGLGNRCLKILLPIFEERVKDKWKAKQGGSQGIDITLPRPDHFRDIIKKYKAANFDAVGIVDLRMGRRAVDYLDGAHPDDVQLWDQFAEEYCNPNKPHITDVELMLASEVQKRNGRLEPDARPYQMPPPGVLTKMIKGRGRFYLTWKREGIAKAEKEFNIVHGGLRLDRLGQRVEIDEWTADIQVLLAKAGVWESLPKKIKALVRRNARPWLTVAIDAASRCILAISFSRYDPDHRSAVRALEMAVSDKTHISFVAGAKTPWIYGLIPEAIVTDAGAGFRHHRFRAAVSMLKALHMFPVSGRPEARGTIESFFNTCGKRFLHWFSGQTFRNIFERGDYDSEANASLQFDEFCLYFVRAILDVYHQTPQEGMAGATPADMWLRLARKSSMMMPVTDEERRLIFGIPHKAAISDKGVVANSLHYQHPLLQKLRYGDPRLPKRNISAPRTDIIVDRFNISRISFFAEGEWHEASTIIGLPNGVSLWEWADAMHIVTSNNKANAEVRLSTMLTAVNELRASGQAAMSRSELGMEAITPKSFDDIQRKHFTKEVVADLIAEDEELAQFVYSSDPLGLPLSIIRDDNKPTEEDPREAARREEKRQQTSSSRSAFTGFRRRSRDDNYDPLEEKDSE